MSAIFKWFATISLALFTTIVVSLSITLAAPASFAATENGASSLSNVTEPAESGQIETISVSTEAATGTTLGTTRLQNGDTIYYRGSYHSGSRAPSSRVSGSRYSGSRTSTTFGSTGRSMFGAGFGSHMFSFGTGWFLSSMFHPFGGYYGAGLHSFSLFGILIDVLVIWIIWRIIRRIFR
jgi:hypothetical protein